MRLQKFPLLLKSTNETIIEVPKCATPQPFEHISDITNSKSKC